MSEPTVNNIPWQKACLVLTLQDKQEGLNILRRFCKANSIHQFQDQQKQFWVNLDVAASEANKAIVRMIRQRQPK